MDALDTFSKTVIPLRNDLLAAVGPHPSGFEDAMRFSEQGLVNLEAAEHRHNMHVHAVEQEDFDELENVEEDEELTCDHDVDMDENLQPDNVEHMSLEEDEGFELPDLAL